jgi:hypothetical protein
MKERHHGSKLTVSTFSGVTPRSHSAQIEYRLVGAGGSTGRQCDEGCRLLAEHVPSRVEFG